MTLNKEGVIVDGVTVTWKDKKDGTRISYLIRICQYEQSHLDSKVDLVADPGNNCSDQDKSGYKVIGMNHLSLSDSDLMKVLEM